MNVTVFLSVVGTFVSLFFSVHLFTVKAGNRLLNFFLGYWFFSRFLDNLLYYAIVFDIVKAYPALLKAFSPVLLTAPSCIYLYFIYFMKDRSRLRLMDLVHLVPPFLLGFSDALAWLISPASTVQHVLSIVTANKSYIYDVDAGLLSGKEFFLLKNGFSYIYIGLILWQFYSSYFFKSFQRKNINDVWLLFLFFGILINQLARSSTTLAISQDHTIPIRNDFFLVISIFSLFFLFSFLVILFRNPQILYGYILLKKSNLSNITQTVHEVEPNNENLKSDKKNSLKAQQLEKYTSLMEDYMLKEKPFLDADFKIGYLADRLGIPQHHCSYILNFILNKNFRDWINGFRIKYFIERYSKQTEKSTIESLALDAGFSNTATFYNAFKKELGVTPKEYFNF